MLGDNRIAVLTTRLARRDFDVGMGSLEGIEPNALDYVIDTGLGAQELRRVLEVLKPGGTLIAKSRHLGSLPLPWNTLVRKDLRIQGLYYGGFADAMALLSEVDVHGLLGDLLGPAHTLTDWRAFVAPEGNGSELNKAFLVMD